MSFIQFSDEPDQEERIAKLRQEVQKLGGNTISLESMPADMEEEFLRHVLEYESAEPISLLRLLENSGLEVPAPDQLDDESLTIKLKEMIERMARIGACIDFLKSVGVYDKPKNFCSKLTGDAASTVILTRVGGAPVALLCRPVAEEDRRAGPGAG